MGIKIYNLEKEKFEEEKVCAEGLMRLLYEKRIGSFMVWVLFKRAFFSRLCGLWADSRRSAKAVFKFIEDNGINTDEMLYAPSNFKTFNEFFTRALADGARPLADCDVSFPADGRHLLVKNASESDVFFIKGRRFDLSGFLGDAALAERFRGADMLISRLCPADYHRFHYPVSGEIAARKEISGALFSVSPIALVPRLSVLWENKRILNNLIKWLSNSRDNTTGKIMLPMLLIDDEADNASVNTKSEDDSPAAINACIRQLLHEFYQASYLGITATPFANIFINPETEDEMIGDDLFPRDFIYSLAPPTNYIGADKIFGDITEFSDVLIPLRREEMNLFFPFTHKKTLEVDSLPPSMYEAIAYFLMFNAIRDLRGDNTEHRSMMIHVSRFTDVQNRIAEAVNEWLVQVKSDVQNYAALDGEKREQIASLRYLHKVWIRNNFSRARSGLPRIKYFRLLQPV